MEESLRCGLLDDWIKNSVFGFEFPFRRPDRWSKIEAVIPLINNDANKELVIPFESFLF